MTTYKSWGDSKVLNSKTHWQTNVSWSAFLSTLRSSRRTIDSQPWALTASQSLPSNIVSALSSLSGLSCFTPLQSGEEGVGETSEEDHTRENSHDSVGVFRFDDELPQARHELHWLWLPVGIFGVVLA